MKRFKSMRAWSVCLLAVILIVTLGLAGCPKPPRQLASVKMLCYTTFEGWQASSTLPLKVGKVAITNNTNQYLGYMVQDVPAGMEVLYGRHSYHDTTSYNGGYKIEGLVYNPALDAYQAKHGGGNDGNYLMILKPNKTAYLPVGLVDPPSSSSNLFGTDLNVSIKVNALNLDTSSLIMGKIRGEIRPSMRLDKAAGVLNLLNANVPGSGDQVQDYYKGYPLGKSIFHSDGVHEGIPQGANELIAGTVLAFGDNRNLGPIDYNVHFDPIFKETKGTTTFPDGQGPNGYTLSANMPIAPAAGDLLVLSMVADADIPLADPVNYYTYGFVADSDGDSTNNWVPDPAFPKDIFQGTDYWFTAEYNPTDGWSLLVRTAYNNNVQEVSSAAKAIISGNSITLVVPLGEFQSMYPRWRLTSFRHSGDFGLNPPYDFDIDLYPQLDERLARISEGPAPAMLQIPMMTPV